jgi:hypothetical protein
VRESSSALRRGEIRDASVRDPSLNGVGSHLLDVAPGAPGSMHPPVAALGRRPTLLPTAKESTRCASRRRYVWQRVTIARKWFGDQGLRARQTRPRPRQAKKIAAGRHVILSASRCRSCRQRQLRGVNWQLEVCVPKEKRTPPHTGPALPGGLWLSYRCPPQTIILTRFARIPQPNFAALPASIAFS